VDIGLVLAPNDDLSAYERMKLEFDIAAEVERRCDVREADIRSIDNAPMTVQGMVVSEGILLFSRDENFVLNMRFEQEIVFRLFACRRDDAHGILRAIGKGRINQW